VKFQLQEQLGLNLYLDGKVKFWMKKVKFWMEWLYTEQKV
jgi:hypothetical protein